MTAGQVTLKPCGWDGFNGWEVLDDANYHLGLVGEYEEPHRFRAYGVRDSLLGFGPVAAEENFGTRQEAVDWIVDGFPGAGS